MAAAEIDEAGPVTTPARRNRFRFVRKFSGYQTDHTYLEIPKNFVEDAGIVPPVEVRLENGDGLRWDSCLAMRANHKGVRFFLTDGWREFAQEAKLGAHDYVMFTLMREDPNVIRIVQIGYKEGLNLVSRAGNGVILTHSGNHQKLSALPASGDLPNPQKVLNIHGRVHAPVFVGKFRMSGPNASHQTAYFYDDVWSEKMDRRLVNELDNEFQDNMWYVGDDSSRYRVVGRVRRLLNVVFDDDFTHEFYEGKKGVRWDSINNTIRADEKTWCKALSDQPLALAYKFQDEPHYTILSDLFESTYTTTEKLDSEEIFQRYEGTIFKEESTEEFTD
ncbi:hypothetical protein C2S51_006736 [Perilla frutescens var. frutescens]|nr:hypothetical protein C2S51_006736 [Perilla frutescens var. frutescens]